MTPVNAKAVLAIFYRVSGLAVFVCDYFRGVPCVILLAQMSCAASIWMHSSLNFPNSKPFATACSKLSKEGLARRTDGGEDQSEEQLKFAGASKLPRSTDD